MDLKGMVALVTGGNGGLGQRICHALAQEGGIGRLGEGMQVGDEVEALVAGLQLDRRLHHPEVVADVQRAGRLNAGQNAFHLTHIAS